MFSHISLERKCFGLEEDVEDVFMYWFCRLDSSSFAHCSYFQHLPALLPVPSAGRLLPCACSVFALACLKFYASTGCVRIGFGSILSCLFVCVCVCGVCVNVCVGVCGLYGCVCVVLLLPVGSLQCVLIDVACSLVASCLLLKQQLLVQLCHAPSPPPAPPPFHPPLLTINLNAPLCIVKSSFCCCRLNRNVKP